MTAYALAFGSLLLLGGRIGDLFGRKWTFIGGLLGFSIASGVGGAATSFGMLVAARGAQGLFGAILAPSALALLTTTFSDVGERRKAFAVFGSIAGGGAAVGFLLGGVLTQAVSWRLTLFVNVAIALPAALAGLWLLVNEGQRNRPALDLPGTATASLGLFALVYGFSNASTHSWSDPLTIGMVIASAALLAAFAAIESRARHPLLPPRVIADRARGGSYLAVLIAGIAMFGAFLFLTYFLQRTKGYTPIQTGLAFLPLPVAVVMTAMTVQIVLLKRLGPRPLMTAGMLLGAGGMAWLAQLSPERRLRRPRPARPGDPRGRDGLDDRPRDVHCHLRRAPPRHRRRLGDGQHDAAGRRCGRRLRADYSLRWRRQLLPARPRSRRVDRGRLRARLHDRVLGLSGRVRRRRDPRRPVGARHRSPRSDTPAESSAGPRASPSQAAPESVRGLERMAADTATGRHTGIRERVDPLPASSVSARTLILAVGPAPVAASPLAAPAASLRGLFALTAPHPGVPRDPSQPPFPNPVLGGVTAEAASWV